MPGFASRSALHVRVLLVCTVGGQAPPPDPPVGSCVGCAAQTFYPPHTALNGKLDLCNCAGGCEGEAGGEHCTCGSACQEAKTAEACCEACMTWAAANSSCKSWFFRGNDKQCMLKGCTSYAECLGQVTPTEDYTSGLGPCLAPAWGWPIVIVLLVASTLYVGGGLVYNVRAKGMAPGPEALPHLDFWHEVRALVEDGASFTATRLKDASGRGAGGEYAALGEAHPPLPVQTGEGGGAIADSGPAAAAAAAAAAGSGGGSSASEDEDSLVE